MGAILSRVENQLWKLYIKNMPVIRRHYISPRYPNDPSPYVYNLWATKERQCYYFEHQEAFRLNYPRWAYETVMTDLTDLEYLVEVTGDLLMFCPWAGRDKPIFEWMRVNGVMTNLERWEEFGERDIEMIDLADANNDEASTITSDDEHELVLVNNLMTEIISSDDETADFSEDCVITQFENEYITNN